MNIESKLYDLIGVGIGPSNLSLAALLQPYQRHGPNGQLEHIFFERRKHFRWHPGLLFPEAELQVSYLKDLVSLVDPTSHFSFLAFLAAKRRLYRFLMSKFPAVKRVEFEQYLTWVAQQIRSLQFGSEVVDINFEQGYFAVTLDRGRRLRSKNVAIGVGVRPNIPAFARGCLGPQVFHAVNFLDHDPGCYSGRRVVVVGGGQTGAEVVHHLLHQQPTPAELTWVSRRSNFLALDDSPFTNELFTPSYSEFFFRLPERQKLTLLQEQKIASDGISEELAQDIYRRLYSLDFHQEKSLLYRFCARLSLVDIQPAQDAWRVVCRGEEDGVALSYDADYVILATGFEQAHPGRRSMLAKLVRRLQLAEDGSYLIGRDFSARWDGPADRKIYVLNGARRTRGVMDPNLSLLAWRSAVIINDLVGLEVYDVGDQHPVLDWGHTTTGGLEVPDARDVIGG